MIMSALCLQLYAQCLHVDTINIQFAGSGLAKAYMEEIMMLLQPLGMTGVEDGAHHPDLGMWDDDIPKGSLDIDRSTYFWYHHTHGT